MTELEKIKEALPVSGIKRIAERLGVSCSLVSLVLSGKRQNDDVIIAALNIIEEEKKRKTELSERIKEALS